MPKNVLEIYRQTSQKILGHAFHEIESALRNLVEPIEIRKKPHNPDGYWRKFPRVWDSNCDKSIRNDGINNMITTCPYEVHRVSKAQERSHFTGCVRRVCMCDQILSRVHPT
ncbi:hypothetical protein ACTXT7_006785 [Hymenolepis weldensis]